MDILGRSLTPNDWVYYLSWSIALLAFAIAWLVLRGRTGRAFRAVRDSETAAVSSGVSLAHYKTLAFGISATYAGVAGGLFAIATANVNPDSFPVALSIFLLVGIVVSGGLGGLSGLVFGAIFVYFLPLWAQGHDLGSLLPGRIVTEAQKPGGAAVVFGMEHSRPDRIKLVECMSDDLSWPARCLRVTSMPYVASTRRWNVAALSRKSGPTSCARASGSPGWAQRSTRSSRLQPPEAPVEEEMRALISLALADWSWRAAEVGDVARLSDAIHQAHQLIEADESVPRGYLPTWTAWKFLADGGEPGLGSPGNTDGERVAFLDAAFQKFYETHGMPAGIETERARAAFRHGVVLCDVERIINQLEIPL